MGRPRKVRNPAVPVGQEQRAQEAVGVALAPLSHEGETSNTPESAAAQSRRKQVERAAVRAGPLRPWMKHFAEWHATQPGRITLSHAHSMARELAGCDISSPNVRLLMNRDDWMQYREEVAMDALLLHRKRFERRMGDYVDAHHWALRHAQAEGDHRSVQQIADPVLDRLWPKREDKGPAAQTIILNLTPQVQAAQVIEYEPMPVEIVPVEPEPTPP